MKRTVAIYLLIILIFVITGILSYRKLSTEATFDVIKISKASVYNRIISMAPSITETLYALELGDRVAGVTRFCQYPAETQEKQNIGGYFDPNYEAIAMLEPDLILLLPDHQRVRKYLDEFEFHYEVVHNRTVSEIIDTITTIGDLCDVEERARYIVSEIQKRMNVIHIKTLGKPQPRVLLSIGRTMGTGTLKDVYIAGKKTFYDELITAIGGKNAYEGVDIAYPVLSAEGLLHIDPDVIIDLVPDLDKRGLDEKTILREWNSVPGVKAVKYGRVHILSGDYTVIPGPRFIMLLEDLARMLHPEIKLDEHESYY